MLTLLASLVGGATRVAPAGHFQFPRAVVERVAPAVALVLPRGVRNTTQQGSAFRILPGDILAGEESPLPTEDWCWLVTAAHVCSPGTTLELSFPGPAAPSRASVRAHLVGRAAGDVDLALIRVGADDLPQEQWPSPLRIRPELACVGEYAIGLGYPSGVLGPAASLGIVCAHAAAFDSNPQARAVALAERQAAEPTYVVTDAALSGGMSGGPLVDAEGDVIGVNVLVRPDLRSLGNYALTGSSVIKAVRELLVRRPDLAAPVEAASWKVQLFNDRMNSRERVSSVLSDAGLLPQEAEAAMNLAHTRGKAVVRTFAPPNAAQEAAAFRDILRAADLLVEAEVVVELV